MPINVDPVNADTVDTALYYGVETVWDEAPAAAARAQVETDYNAEDIQETKQTEVSERIRQDHRTDELADVGRDLAGGFDFELQYSTYDTFWSHFLGSTFASDTIGPLTTISFSTTQILDSANGFAGVTVGQYVQVSGSTSNDGYYRVTVVAAGALTTAETLVTETAGASITVNGNYIRDGTTRFSGVLEKRHLGMTGSGSFETFSGWRWGECSLSIPARGKITGRFGGIGGTHLLASATVSGGDTSVTARELLTASAHLSAISFDDVAQTIPIESLNLTMTRNHRGQPVAGQATVGGIGYGQILITGTINAYYQDVALYNHIINHTAVRVSWRLVDTLGNAFIITLPRVRFSGGAPLASGISQDKMLPAAFTAIEDTTTSAMVQIDSIPT